MHNSLAGRKIRTLDDTLRVFQDRDLNSPVIGHFPEGVEIQLGAVSEIEGREWVEATLPDGTAGYLVSASARSHAEAVDSSLPPAHPVPEQQVAGVPMDADGRSERLDPENEAASQRVRAEFDAKFADKENLDFKDLYEFRKYAKSRTDLRAPQEHLSPDETAWKMMYHFLTTQLEKIAPEVMQELQPPEQHLDSLDHLGELMEAKLKARPHDLGFKVSWVFVIAGLFVGWLRSSEIAFILVYGLIFWLAGTLFSIFVLDSAFVQSVTGIWLAKSGFKPIGDWLCLRSLTIRYSDDELRAEYLRLSDECSNAATPWARAKSEAKFQELIEKYPEAINRVQEQELGRSLDEYNRVVEPILGRDTEVDLSGAAAKTREHMGWPPAGSVRGLPGAAEDIVEALEYIEAHGGKVPFKEAMKIAALDPKSPEAYYLRYRSKKNRSPL